MKEKILNKNVAIIILSIALVLVSGAAIGLAVSHEGHDGRGEEGGRFSEINNNEIKGQMNAGYDDHNQNPNDVETQDDQATTTTNLATTTQMQKVK
jgi:hypothetical protein